MSLQLKSFLPYRLVRLATLVSSEFAKVYAEEAGLSVAQWRVLAHLAENPHSSAKQLCDLALMDKSTVSRAVKQMVDEGYVVTEINSEDKRAALLSLSTTGTAMYQRLSPKALEWEETFLASLGAGERDQLMGMLANLESKIGKSI
ncbi:MarR family winged helix-turn-helix transcriptional regulator [Pseudoalteromonas fenneropenaei]|uniref:MarR family winged helix-turn-helix transcriptional regulator n=1 Tax=Pseudoalteromonas fenneropenaei TaxID=1737459 RepID=A0ABV7CQ40_9GAMM